MLAAEERHHLPVIVIGEYRYGLIRSRHGARLNRLLDLLIRESFVLPVAEETAEYYAHLRDELRSLARPIPENDVWVAALARQYDERIVTATITSIRFPVCCASLGDHAAGGRWPARRPLPAAR